MEDILFNCISILAGALVTLVASRVYYGKASKELKHEAQKLRRLNVIMLRAMKEAGLAKFVRDSNGNIKGLWFNRRLSTRGHSSTPEKPANISRDHDYS